MTRTELFSNFFTFDDNGRQNGISERGMRILIDYLDSMCIESGFFYHSEDMIENWIEEEYDRRYIDEMVKDGIGIEDILVNVWNSFISSIQERIDIVKDENAYTTARRAMHFSSINPLD